MRSRLLVTALALLSPLTACGDDSSGGGGTDGTSSTTSEGTAESSESSATQDTTAATDTPTGTTDGASTSSSSNASADGSSGDSTDETGAGLCPDVGDPCTICESTQCPDAYCDCFNNGSCVLLAQCTAGCDIGDAACNQACWTQYPEGISDGAVLTHCAGTTCMADCGAYVPLTDCQQCLYTECPLEMNTCVSNPECSALLACLDACEDPGCENTCYAVHPDGLADSGPVGECAQDACLQACA